MNLIKKTKGKKKHSETQEILETTLQVAATAAAIDILKKV